MAAGLTIADPTRDAVASRLHYMGKSPWAEAPVKATLTHRTTTMALGHVPVPRVNKLLVVLVACGRLRTRCE